MTSPTQKGEREEALEAARRIIAAGELYERAHKTEGGFRFPCEPSEEQLNFEAVTRGDAVDVARALLSSSKAEGEMREDLETQKEQAAWRESGRRRVIDEIAKKMDLYDPRVGDMIRALEDQT